MLFRVRILRARYQMSLIQLAQNVQANDLHSFSTNSEPFPLKTFPLTTFHHRLPNGSSRLCQGSSDFQSGDFVFQLLLGPDPSAPPRLIMGVGPVDELHGSVEKQPREVERPDRTL